MFDDKFFDDWLDGQAQKVMEKVASGEGIAPYPSGSTRQYK